LDSCTLSHIRRSPTPMDADPARERYEIPMDTLTKVLRERIEEEAREIELSGIVMSLQMHGMLLWDEENRPLTDYLTWMDGRAGKIGADGLSAVARLERRAGREAFRTTGMRLNSSHTAAQVSTFADPYGDRAVRLSLLGDAVAEILTGGVAPAQRTNAQSTAMYDPVRGVWNGDIVAATGMKRLILPGVANDIPSVGCVRAGGREIPLYAAVGDQQASLLGALPREGELIVNAGTGAQIILLEDEPRFGAYETRPMLGGGYLRTVSDLPAGRCLNVLMRFLEDAGERLFGAAPDRDALWENALREADRLEDAGGLVQDMGFFSLGGGMGGSLRGITEENLTFDRWLYSAYESMAEAYATAYENILDPDRPARGILCMGGIALKTPLFRRILEKRFSLPVRLAPYGEDALMGLLRLALTVSGRCKNLREAGERLGA